MKKALLLYNPMAGNRKIVGCLDVIAEKLQNLGYILSLYRSDAPGSIEKYIYEKVTGNIDLILISGGDGTINECINGTVKKNLDIPILILPLGTANDFANAADIPANIEDTLSLLEDGELTNIDVGKVNGQYFINVCNMGLFSGVSHEMDLDMKKDFGKLAYYAKGIGKLQKYETMDLEIAYEDKVLRGEYTIVFIFNGKGAGGFNKLAKEATIQDGYFDVVAVKDVERYEIPRLFIKALQGEHLSDANVDYIKISAATITCKNDKGQFDTDVDGEVGPEFPLHIEVVTNKVRVYLPNPSTQKARNIAKINDETEKKGYTFNRTQFFGLKS
ncbi:MAG: lipid kinase [Epulopiscium sp. Nele67-Bin004]|nr:MAG: lipid kinase [Epulopiscium sp. Nele67-Bin004]